MERVVGVCFGSTLRVLSIGAGDGDLGGNNRNTKLLSPSCDLTVFKITKAGQEYLKTTSPEPYL
jgi:hypothetical protein